MSVPERKFEHRWSPIEDLPGDWKPLASTDLPALSRVWAEQKDALGKSGALTEFKEKLAREWAVETGLIERLYSFEHGVTITLIEQGIDAALIPHAPGQDPERVRRMILDQRGALDQLFVFVEGARRLGTSYIKELHALITRHQDTTLKIDSLGNAVEAALLKGAYKTQPNSPQLPDGSIHEYCPPEHVDAEMEKLVALHEDHEQRKVPPEVEAAWLHHRFTQIHPFEDGNGRIARILGSLVLIKAGWMPLVVTSAMSADYRSALLAADRGNLKPLVGLFTRAIRDRFVRALGIAGTVLQHESVKDVVGSIRAALERRAAEQRKAWDRAKQTAKRLRKRALEVLERLEKQLATELKRSPIRVRTHVRAGPEKQGEDLWYFAQLVSVARQLGYYANLKDHHEWCVMGLDAGGYSEILVSFHTPGFEFRGLIACTVCFYRKERSEEGVRQPVDVATAADELFQVNYVEDPDAAEARFNAWLDAALVRALEMWRRTL
jgi:hypothetical protein